MKNSDRRNEYVLVDILVHVEGKEENEEVRKLFEVEKELSTKNNG